MISTIEQHPEGKPPAPTWNEEIRARLAAYKKETGASDSQLATQIGSNATSINRYINQNPVGDVEALERKVVEFFERLGIIASAPAVSDEFIKTSVVETLMGMYRRVQRTQDFAIISGPAGCGKTTTSRRFLSETTTAIGITVTRDTRTGYGVERMILSRLPRKGLNNFATPFEFICSKLTDSRRLLLVDNAHKLSQSGWETLFDLHDETRIPIACQGNATMESAIKGVKLKDRERNEQHVTRIGLRYSITPKYNAAQVEEFTGLYFREPSMHLLKLCSKVANSTGHLRALRKHLLLLPDFLEVAKGNDADAFRMAHTQLLTDVSLREEA